MELLIFGLIGLAAWGYVKLTAKRADTYANTHRIDWEKYLSDRAAHQMSDYEADRKILNGEYNAAKLKSRFFYTID